VYFKNDYVNKDRKEYIQEFYTKYVINKINTQNTLHANFYLPSQTTNNCIQRRLNMTE